jgi:prepilin-type N-terminal cleavage/methylation domain-containing protein
MERARGQRGFTLVELLMALTIGSGVLLAAYTLSDSVLHAQTRISDRTEAIQHGRTGLEQISQQLRSQVCLGPGMPALVYGDASRVIFYADLASTTFVPQRRDLQFSGGAIVQRDYDGAIATSGTLPYTFGTTPVRTRTIVDSLVLLRDRGGIDIPFFTYYAFDAGRPARPSQQLAVPLSASNLAKVVQIRVSFGALAARGGSSVQLSPEPFTANVFVRTADPTDPDHSPLCL